MIPLSALRRVAQSDINEGETSCNGPFTPPELQPPTS